MVVIDLLSLIIFILIAKSCFNHSRVISFLLQYIVKFCIQEESKSAPFYTPNKTRE